MLQNPEITAKAIAIELALSQKNIEANIRAMKRIGIIIREGSNKAGHWIIKTVEE